MKKRININLSQVFDPHLTGSERQALIQREILKIAICINGGDRLKVSEYLGITSRTLRNHLNASPELKELLVNRNDPMRPIRARRLKYMLTEYDY